MDGAALQILRGTGRYFRAMNFAVLAELPLADGRRCDLMALDAKGDIAIVEIKSCMADFRTDQKWPEYRQWCDRFYFAVDADFPQGLIPEDCGLILADRFGADVLREPPEHRLNSARRKAVTLRFARCTAFRLHELFDPELRAVGLL
ncbi:MULTISPECIES: MmcB family DNA repair protein [Rhodomicrobium]|uniref:MmcB family DNA repair protein n=1 Tax=Rhodomicrobium TaxID=1068 RepID=UPI000B4BC8F9|nr:MULTISPECIES: MmcB family DNA repair protein [Rhodomicrobium]